MAKDEADEKEDVRDSDEADANKDEGTSEEEHAPKAAKSVAGKHAIERSAEKAHSADHAHGAGHHAPNRKEYMVIFVVLFVLTVLEVGVAQIPGIAKILLTIALVALAVTKAAFVGLYYMHLKHETQILKLSVAIPMAMPALYALVLIADAAWRLTR